MVQVKGALGTPITLTITLADGTTGLADGAGRVADQYDGGAQFPLKGWISVITKTGTVAPAAGSLLEFYLAYADPDGNISDGGSSSTGIGTEDGDLSNKPENVQQVGSLVMNAALAQEHRTIFPVFDLPRKWSLIVWNETGEALSTTASDHVIKFIPQFDETV
jgi:hypothetical protein